MLFESNHKILSIAWLVITLSSAWAQQAPCVPKGQDPNGYTQWKEQEKRSTGVATKAGTSECDRYIDDTWYRVSSIAGEVMPTTCVDKANVCGTMFPVWMDGTNPTTIGSPVSRRACVSNFLTGQMCCMAEIEIQVCNCSDFMVYKLPPVPGCDMGYCFGHRTPCTDGLVSLTGLPPCGENVCLHAINETSVTVATSSGDEGFEFHCNFDFNVSSPSEVRVTWYLDDVQFRNDTVTYGYKAVLLDSELMDSNVRLGFLLHCSAQITNPFCLGEVITSERFFAGIEVVKTTGVSVVDGITQITIKEGATAYIELKLTVPLVCTALEIELGICQFNIEVHASDASELDSKPPTCAGGLEAIQKLIFGKLDITRCHYEVNNTNHDSVIRIPVVAVRDNVYDQSEEAMLRPVKLMTPSFIFSHSIWQDYEIGTVRMKILDTDRNTAGRRCSMRTDPWLSTFDGRGNSFQHVGEFEFYRHEYLPIRVHVFTYSCSRRASCVCAVVIQAGRDVIIIDKCNYYRTGFNQAGRLRSRLAAHGCDGLGKDLRLIEHSNSYYEVFLPTGAAIVASARSSWFNIFMRPSDQDYGVTTGLCGKWNGNSADDLSPRPGSSGQTFAESWRVPSDQSLYNGRGLDMTGDLYSFVHCDCSCKERSCARDDGNPIVCNSTTYNLCPDTFDKDISNFMNDKCNRKKKSVDQHDEEDDIEYVFDQDINFVAQPAVWPTPSGMTEAEAREICEAKLVTSEVGVICGNMDILKVHQEQTVAECMGDIQASDSLDFVEASYDNFVDLCREEILRNLTNWETSDENNGTMRSPPKLLTKLCPNNCAGNGVCVAGICKCNAGFFDRDCNRSVSDPPETFGLLRDGQCDFRTRPCKSVIVYGANFHHSDTLTCHMIPVIVGDEATPLKAPILTRALYEYSEEVRCPIPSWPEDVDVGDGNQGYMVSVSNDGLNPGGEFLFVKYDPACGVCNTTEQTCSRKKNICNIEDFCYNDGETASWNQCFLCNISAAKDKWTIKDSPECVSTCFNGGTYTVDQTCLCSEGFTGDQCSTDIDECSSSPCQNGGSCFDRVAGYICECPENFTGSDCQLEQNDPSVCSDDPCVNGVCSVSNNIFLCTCNLGFTGLHCDVNVDECNPNPCLNGGSCVDEVNGYQCTCIEGYIGDNCEDNVDECLSAPCKNEGTCIDEINGYRCMCVEGYYGIHCNDISDGCLPPNPCGNGGSCVSQDGGYVCVCMDGYSGIHCEENIDGCLSNPCVNGVCNDEAAGFSCDCFQGYTGTRCETSNGECHSNPCKNLGRCVNVLNGYKCECVNGYTGIHCETNINECDPLTCLNGGVCYDEINGYSCQCPREYMGENCQQVNFCHSNPCLNGGKCSNRNDGFQCTCPTGFTGNRCQDQEVVDKCTNVQCENGGSCIVQDYGYLCNCRKGFHGINCETEIDECNRNPCQNDGLCIDGIGQFTCKCKQGFYGKYCESDAVQCANYPCQNGGLCQSHQDGYVCECDVGYDGKNCEIDASQCASNPCKNGGLCDLHENGYLCLCDEGFNGTHCENSINGYAEIVLRFVEEEWLFEYKNKHSRKYQEFKNKIEPKVKQWFESVEGFKYGKVKNLRKGSVIAEIVLVIDPEICDVGSLNKSIEILEKDPNQLFYFQGHEDHRISVKLILTVVGSVFAVCVIIVIIIIVIAKTQAMKKMSKSVRRISVISPKNLLIDPIKQEKADDPEKPGLENMSGYGNVTSKSNEPIVKQTTNENEYYHDCKQTRPESVNVKIGTTCQGQNGGRIQKSFVDLRASTPSRPQTPALMKDNVPLNEVARNYLCTNPNIYNENDRPIGTWSRFDQK